MRRVFRVTAGSALVMAGTVMLVTPGPGLLTIAAGLHILSKDVPAAARLKDNVAERIKNGRGGHKVSETENPGPVVH